MKAKTKARHRGRVLRCDCGEEKFVLTRTGALLVRKGPNGRIVKSPAEPRIHDRWAYLIGDCGAGVKLRFDGVKIVAAESVGIAENARISRLPAVRRDPYEAIVERLDARARARLEQIAATVDQKIAVGLTNAIEVGDLLLEAKGILKHGDFGAWVERRKLDAHNAFKFMRLAERAHERPALLNTFRKIGQEKSIALIRLPDGKLSEVIEHGVPIAGQPKPLDQVTFRQLNNFIRSIIGKSGRGRKKTPAPATKPTERLGLPIALFDAFQEALKGLQALKVHAKAGFTDAQRPAARQLWGNVNRLFFELQDERGFGELLA